MMFLMSAEQWSLTALLHSSGLADELSICYCRLGRDADAKLHLSLASNIWDDADQDIKARLAR